MIGRVVKVNNPAERLRLLNVVGAEPAIIPALIKPILPVPAVKVPLLMKVAEAARFMVKEAPKLIVPVAEFVMPVVVSEPAAPVKLNVPLFRRMPVAVKTGTVAVTVAVIPLLMVICAGLFRTAAAMVNACAMVTLAPFAGKAPPSHELAVFQFVAPVLVMKPRLR